MSIMQWERPSFAPEIKTGFHSNITIINNTAGKKAYGADVHDDGDWYYVENPAGSVSIDRDDEIFRTMMVQRKRITFTI